MDGIRLVAALDVRSLKEDTMNFYPELPALDYQRTVTPMPDIIAYLMLTPRACEVRRAAYIMVSS